MNRNQVSAFLPETMWRFIERKVSGVNAKNWERISPSQWTRVQRLSRRGRIESRIARRIYALFSFALISFFPVAHAALLWHHPVPRQIAGDPYFLLLPVFFAWAALRGMQRSLSPTLEQRARQSYGSGYQSLDEGKRFLILLERLGGRQSAEHDRELDVHRSVASRLLTFVLMLAVGTYWVLSVLRPIANQHGLALASADAAIWLASLAIILPTMVRMWVQPDFLGE